MDIRDLRGKWAVVTGAASGIGRASAIAFAKRGAHLALCDLDLEGLEETATRARNAQVGLEVLCERVDVARAEQVEAFANKTHERCEAVDLLMNNAGVAVGGRFRDTELEDWQWIVGINLMGVVHGCRAFTPQMVARRSGGHVVNVASAAGYFATQALAAYSTTKFAVLGFSEALRDELAGDGIGVTALCPGIINTPITRAARMRGPAAAGRGRVVENYERRNFGPERVAEAVLHAVQRNRAVAPVTPEAWGMYWLKRFAPRLSGWLVHRASVRGLREMTALAQAKSD